eukprot:364046-Chlamydomonas_euryale.AAC.1
MSTYSLDIALKPNSNGWPSSFCTTTSPSSPALLAMMRTGVRSAAMHGGRRAGEGAVGRGGRLRATVRKLRVSKPRRRRAAQEAAMRGPAGSERCVGGGRPIPDYILRICFEVRSRSQNTMTRFEHGTRKCILRNTKYVSKHETGKGGWAFDKVGSQTTYCKFRNHNSKGLPCPPGFPTSFASFANLASLASLASIPSIPRAMAASLFSKPLSPSPCKALALVPLPVQSPCPLSRAKPSPFMTMSAPRRSSSVLSVARNAGTSSDRCSSAAPPPGTMPSSTAANVAFLASSMRSLRSSSSDSVAAPTCTGDCVIFKATTDKGNGGGRAGCACCAQQ